MAYFGSEDFVAEEGAGRRRGVEAGWCLEAKGVVLVSEGWGLEWLDWLPKKGERRLQGVPVVPGVGWCAGGGSAS